MNMSNLQQIAGATQADYPLIIIGNGMACFALLSELLPQPNRPQRILVIGDEALPAYNRVLLSPVLAGELAPEQAMLEPLAWYQQHGIDLHLNDPVVVIDRIERRVISQQGFCWRYQQLVFACGAKGSTPDYAQKALGSASNICHFRNWRDLTLLQQTAARFQPHEAPVKTGANTETEDSHKAETEDSHKAETEDSHKAETEDSHKTETEDSHKTETEDSHKTETEDSHKAETEDSHKAETEDSHKAETEDSHKAETEDSHKAEIKDSHKPGHAIVVGGGFLGLEAAEGLRKQGMQVCLLQRSRYLLNRQLDATASDLLASELRGRGLMILTGREIASLQHKADGNVSVVMLKDGRRLACDLLVLALGISPNVHLAQLAGVKTNSGICVDCRLQSSDQAIFALGECSEFAGQTFGLLAPIRSQANVLAKVLTGSTATFTPDNTATALKISGIDLWSCGDIPTLLKDPTSFDQTAVYQDHQLGDYRKLWWQQGRLVGAVLYGDTSNSLFYGQLLQQAALEDRHQSQVEDRHQSQFQVVDRHQSQIEDSHQIQTGNATLLFGQPVAASSAALTSPPLPSTPMPSKTVSPTTDPNLSPSVGELAA